MAKKNFEEPPIESQNKMPSNSGKKLGIKSRINKFRENYAKSEDSGTEPGNLHKPDYVDSSMEDEEKGLALGCCCCISILMICSAISAMFAAATKFFDGLGRFCKSRLLNIMLISTKFSRKFWYLDSGYYRYVWCECCSNCNCCVLLQRLETSWLSSAEFSTIPQYCRRQSATSNYK